jgi:hypothetical protein
MNEEESQEKRKTPNFMMKDGVKMDRPRRKLLSTQTTN